MLLARLLTKRSQSKDHTYEGYSTRPTALLAMYLKHSKEHRRLLLDHVTANGTLTGAKLRQLVHRQRNRWLNEAIPDEANSTEPFPPFSPYREEVEFDEIAAELTTLHAEGNL